MFRASLVRSSFHILEQRFSLFPEGPGPDGNSPARGNYRAYAQLLGLSQAALMPQALTFDIPISMFLKGSRGIGKFTTATQVAQHLGMHIFEVGAQGLCVCV
jgi:hypothetical protein